MKSSINKSILVSVMLLLCGFFLYTARVFRPKGAGSPDVMDLWPYFIRSWFVVWHILSCTVLCYIELYLLHLLLEVFSHNVSSLLLLHTLSGCVIDECVMSASECCVLVHWSQLSYFITGKLNACHQAFITEFVVGQSRWLDLIESYLEFCSCCHLSEHSWCQWSPVIENVDTSCEHLSCWLV